MNFDQKFAEFIQKNPTLAAPDSAQGTLTVKQLRKIAHSFWKSGRDEAQVETPLPTSLFDLIFGQDRRN